MDPKNRDTILVEQATLLDYQAYPQKQFHFRLQAPKISMRAKPGQFIHLRCGNLLMRRPMSIMRTKKEDGWIEILFKVHGIGTTALSKYNIGDQIDLLGPIGQGFKTEGYQKYPLLIGGGIGIPPLIMLAEHMKISAPTIQPLVLLGSQLPFPFQTHLSKQLVPNVPNDVIASMALLDDWQITNRLASESSYPGCFNGYVTDLAAHWLTKLSLEQRAEVEIFSCGPIPMLEAVADVAKKYAIACQISMEEYMACAVGGCAGCAITVKANKKKMMQRVCVDGPVFTAHEVFF